MTRLPPQSNPWGRVTEEGKGDLVESQTLVLSSAASDYALTCGSFILKKYPESGMEEGVCPQLSESHLVEQRSKIRGSQRTVGSWET